MSRAQEITWYGTSNAADIGPDVSILQDKEGRLSIEAVNSEAYRKQFSSSHQEVLRLGFSESIYWLRFVVANNTTDSLWLELDHAFIPYAELFFKDVSGNWLSYKSGYKVSLQNKIIKDHFQVFPLLRGTNEYYIKLLPLMHPIRMQVWNSNAYQLNAVQQKMTYGIYMGIIFFAIVINIFLFFLFRRVYYLLYAALIFVYMVASAGVMEGYIIYFFPRFDLMDGYKFIPVINIPILLLYCSSFLELRKHSKILYRITAASCLALLVYTIAMFFLPTMPVLLVNYALALLTFILAIIIGVVVGKRGNRMGYYFVAAYSAWFVLLLLEEIYIQTGVPPHILNLSYVSLASFIESILLAFLLVKRFQWDKKEDERMKSELQNNIVRMQAKFEQEILQTKLEIQEQTFNSISQEIHDNIGQVLTLVKLNLSLVVSESGLKESDMEKLTVSKGLVANVIGDLRDLAKAMNTNYIRNVGLTGAVDQQVSVLQRTGAFKIKFVVNGTVERYEINKELFVFRIIQELLNNIIKHSAATSIEMTITYDQNKLSVEVNDDGKGFNVSDFEKGQTKGVGLYSISERVKLLGGEVSIQSTLSKGTAVFISVPKYIF